MALFDLLDSLVPGEIRVQHEISFSDAIEAHVAWKTLLTEALASGPVQGRIAREVGDDGACTLGRWILGTGYRRYGHLPAFDEVRKHHSRFHQVARDIVELHRADQSALAAKLMAEEFEDASRSVVRHLSSFAAGS